MTRDATFASVTASNSSFLSVSRAATLGNINFTASELNILGTASVVGHTQSGGFTRLPANYTYSPGGVVTLTSSATITGPSSGVRPSLTLGTTNATDSTFAELFSLATAAGTMTRVTASSVGVATVNTSTSVGSTYGNANSQVILGATTSSTGDTFNGNTISIVTPRLLNPTISGSFTYTGGTQTAQDITEVTSSIFRANRPSVANIEGGTLGAGTLTVTVPGSQNVVLFVDGIYENITRVRRMAQEQVML